MFADSQLDRPLDELPLVFFDIETTGLEYARCHIIEVAAVEFRGGKETARFSSFVKPIDPDQPATLFGKPVAAIPAEITRITGIGREMVEGAPEFEEIYPALRKTFGEAILVAHNAEFDLSFLAHKLEKMGEKRPTNPIIDTLKLSRALERGPGPHNMDYLKKKYGITAAKAHRALDDTLALQEVFLKLAAQIPRTGPLKLRDLVKLHGPPLEFRVYPSQGR